MNQIKKSLVLSGHKTSIALEKEFWIALEIISKNQNIDIDKLIEDYRPSLLEKPTSGFEDIINSF